MITQKNKLVNSTVFKNLLGLILVIGSIVFTIILLFSVETKEAKQIKKDGVYVVGRATSIGQRRKSSADFIYTYRYKGAEYKFEIGDVASFFKKGELVFLKISASNPEYCNYSERKFPRPGPCITFETQPAEGWKEIPTCK